MNPHPIVRLSEVKAMGYPEGMVAALGGVLIRYKCPVEYPNYIILLDLIWVGDE